MDTIADSTTMPATPDRPRRRLPAELWFFTALLVIANLHLVGVTGLAGDLLLTHDALSPEVWRLVTHPFVHLSWYHLLLDGAAFLSLYAMLEGCWRKRLPCLAGAWLGSLALVAVVLPGSEVATYCGLSGIAHGLMAVVSLQFIGDADPLLSRAGKIALKLVVAKCLVELLIGGPLLGAVHLGNVGVPIVEAHLGGVLGGVLAWLAVRYVGAKRRRDNAA